MNIDTWKNCYPSNWRGMIVPDAITHPAKYSSKLIRKIYDHICEEGWVETDDCVIDPFGGVALGALDAMRHGLRYRGVELEPKFATIGNENIKLWNSKFSSMPKWNPDALLIQGDSRKLVEILSEATISISSPPFRQSSGGTPEPKPGGSIDAALYKRHAAGNSAAEGYGKTDGQLANMPEGDFGLVVSSPPYADSIQTSERGGSGIDYTKIKNGGRRKTKGRENIAVGYGDQDGQLGAMKAGDFDMAVSSPPYESSALPQDRRDYSGLRDHLEKKYGRTMKRSAELMGSGDYGNTEGQIGKESGETFWIAARTIVEQVHIVLKPGGHAVWVVKDFVKNKQVVPFCDQWRQLCESVGFETLHEHHAELVRHQGTSHTLDGGEHKQVKSSKSFFRRVAESHGSPEINYETVFCMVKHG